MPRLLRRPLWGRSMQRTFKTMARKTLGALSAGSRVLARSAPSAARQGVATGNWSAGVAIGVAGARRYRLYQPPAIKRGESLPLLVMLHGCGQNAEALAASSRMNRVAARERFLVLYPEQERIANMQGCWNWYDTRSGRAQNEAASIITAIDQVCRLKAVDAQRVALAGLSAGAGMAALLATRYPQRFQAIAMHSGIAPGVAYSSASALGAMSGRRVAALPFADLSDGPPFPPLLVIHGSADAVVAPSNGLEAVQRWAARAGARAGTPRGVQRGARYAATITDYRRRGAIVATLCAVKGLGHAWSGGAPGHKHSDPKGPDASRMIWAFAARQFAAKPALARARHAAAQSSPVLAACE